FPIHFRKNSCRPNRADGGLSGSPGGSYGRRFQPLFQHNVISPFDKYKRPPPKAGPDTSMCFSDYSAYASPILEDTLRFASSPHTPVRHGSAREAHTVAGRTEYISTANPSSRKIRQPPRIQK